MCRPADACSRPAPRRSSATTRALVATLLIVGGHLSSIGFIPIASAQTTRTWTSATSGSWHTAGNWNPVGVPADGDTVVIPDQPGDITISISSFTAAVLSVTSAEHVLISNTLTITSTGTFNGGLTMTSVARLDGAGQVILTAPMDWQSGTVGLGGGLEVPPGQTLTLSDGTSWHQLHNSSLRNRGTVSWAADPFLILTSGTVINEAGALWIAAGDLSFTQNVSGPGTFTNHGVIRKTAGAGALTFGTAIAVTNSITGTIDVQTGSLTATTLTNRGTILMPADSTLSVTQLTNSGTLQIPATATLGLGLSTLEAGTTFVGTGTLEVSNDVSVAADLTLPLLLRMTGGNSRLSGTGRVTLAAPMDWQAGTVSLGGGLEVPPGQTLTLSDGTSWHQLHNSSLRNRGTVTWLADTFYVQGTNTIVNEAGAVWNLGGNLLLSQNVSGSATFTNVGLLRQTGPIGTLTFGSAITLINTGTIASRLGGSAAGQYDRMAAGAVTLGGILDVTLINGFQPTTSQQFSVVTYTSRTGAFATINGNGTTYESAYQANAFVIGLEGQTGSIAGRVTNGFGPFADVTVSAFTTAGTLAGSAVTNANGDYTVSGLPSGTYVLATNAAENFVDLVWINIPCLGPCALSLGAQTSISFGAAVTGRNFFLSPGATIAGTVTGAGAPLANVTVALYSGTDALLGTATTNAAGEYRFSKLPGGLNYSYRLLTAVGALNFIDEVYQNVPCIGTCSVLSGAPIGISAGGAQPAFNFDLDAAASISGVITTAGTPQGGVAIQAYSAAGALVASAASDGAGNYTITKLPPGTYYLRTAATINVVNEVWNNHPCVGLCPATTGEPTDVSTGASIGGRDFDLQAGGSISGRVTNETTGAPLANLTVLAFTSTGQPAGSAITDAAGVYHVIGLAFGTYGLRTANAHGMIDEVYDNRRCLYDQPCPVSTGTILLVRPGSDVPDRDIALTPGGTISGLVTDATTHLPVAGAIVSIWDLSGRFATSGTTDAAGAYTTALGLPTGTYVALAGSPGYVRQRYAGTVCFPTCVITSGTPIAVTLGSATANIDFALARGGRISGRVTDGLYPLPGIEVRAVTSDGTLATSALTDAVGQYLTEDGLVPGSYRLHTRNASGRVDEIYDNVPCVGVLASCGGGTLVPIAGTETVVNRDFGLGAGARIGGRITDEESGSPLAQVGVLIFNAALAQVGDPAADPGVLRVNAVTDADGRYTIATGLPAGNYYLATLNALDYVDERHDGGICVQARCDLTFNNPPVVVPAGAAVVTLDFRLARGGGVAGTVRGPDFAPLPGVRVDVVAATGLVVGRTTTDAAGFYTLPGGLHPGSYYVRTRNLRGYVDEVYDNLICLGCPVTGATPVPVIAGTTTNGVDFSLGTGGLVTGTIYVKGSGAALAQHPVSLLQQSGGVTRVAATAVTDANGVYAVGLPAGSYYAQADGKGGYQVTLYGPGGGVPRYRRNADGTLDDACPRGLCDPEYGFEIPVEEGGVDNQIDIGVVSCSGLTLGPAALPNVPFGTPYPATMFTVSGGRGPYGYFVTSGQLPPGLTLHVDTGALTGTPLAAGSTSFEVTGVDSDGCTATRVYTPTFCGYGVPASGVVGPAAGTGSFPVNLAAAGCSGSSFAAASNAPWLTVTGVAGSGTPAGVVSYSYQARGNVSASRAATIAVAGHTFTLTQTGVPAVITATPLAGGVIGPGAYNTDTIVVTTNTLDAAWSATVDQPWLTVSPASGVGSGSITVSVLRNPTLAPRTGAVTIAGTVIPITQRANGVPGPPVQLGATVNAFTVNFAWLPPTAGGDATSYELVAGSGPGLSNIGTIPRPTSSYTVAPVPAGRYYVRVRAKNEFGTSVDSAEYVLHIAADGKSPPGPPLNLAATMAGSQLTLTWTPSGLGSPATGYIIEAGTASGLANIAAIPHSGTTFTYAPVPPGLYYLRVRGVNTAGTGDASNEIRLNVGNVPEPPNPPQNLAFSVSGSTVTLTWTPPLVTANNAAASYTVEAGSAPGLANLATASIGNQTSATFAGVPPGTYFVRVRARNGAGAGDASNEVTVVVR